MSFYLQQGYGKGDRLTSLGNDGRVDGIILSPADEDRETLARTATQARTLNYRVILDPQSYIYSMDPQGEGRRHESHGLVLNNMHWSQDARSVADHVDAVGSANDAIGINDQKIAPSCFQLSFSDVWTSLALQYARTASTAWGSENTIATIAVDESAFSDWPTVERWLDVATTVDARGFYLLVARGAGQYPLPPWDANRTANMLRFIYTLSEINEYSIIWGYSDIEGLLGLGAGATSIASGWHYSLRHFRPSKWQPSTTAGGRSPAPRVHVNRLWTPIRTEGEASAIYQSSLREQIFTPLELAKYDERHFELWNRSDSQHQHLRLLSRRAARLGALPFAQRLDSLTKELSKARELLNLCKAEDIALSPVYSSRIDNFLAALEIFAESENL
ncbi:hypothetical protein [Kineococcus arenarius]|uniref:hypothetical protein n=1 Tax=unclassified Kineococcus TaxID=2621656 RepID=UPI003D7D78BC